MTKEERIEQYIQFAIWNGLDIPPMVEGWYSIENNTLKKLIWLY